MDECDVLCAGDVLCNNQLLSEVSKGVREWGRGGGWVSGCMRVRVGAGVSEWVDERGRE